MAFIRYIDPAGNVTAIVRSQVDKEERVELSKKILQKEKAEQVAFEVAPIMGGDCRIEMMGGEFCGNATRGYAYLIASEKYSGGRHVVKVEISGYDRPVVCNVDLDAGVAYAMMPLPLGIEEIYLENATRPVIHMPGIDHVIMEGCEADEELAEAVLRAMGKWKPDACGIMFLNGDEVTPVVYVRSTESLVFESSCGSGTLACALHLAASTGMLNEDGVYTLDFTQPGGELKAGIMVKKHQIVQCMMGGKVAIGKEEIVEVGETIVLN